MAKFQRKHLKALSGRIWLGAVLIVIGITLIVANHTLGILPAVIGAGFLVRGYIYDSWFRKPPSD